MAAKANKRGSRKQTKKKNTETGFVGIEIVIWVTLAVSVLMMISNFGFGGFIGEAIAGICDTDCIILGCDISDLEPGESQRLP